MKKSPEERSNKELESFLKTHKVSLPNSSIPNVYRQLLLHLSHGILLSYNRTSINVENKSLLPKMKKTWGKLFSKSTSVHSEPVQMRGGDDVYVNRDRTFLPKGSDPLEEQFVQAMSNLELDQDELDSFSDESFSPIYANVQRPEVPPPLPPKMDSPPPLPPKSHRFRPKNQYYSDESLPEMGRPSANFETGDSQNPAKKRKLLRGRDHAKTLNMPIQSTPANRPNKRPGNFQKDVRPQWHSPMSQDHEIYTSVPKNEIPVDSNQLPVENQELPVPKPFQSGNSTYKTKFTTIYNEKDQDIEAYIAALTRWKRLNSIPDKFAISAGLQNFKSVELANFTESGLTPKAFSDFETFSSEVRKLLGRTSTQWLDSFDSCRRSSSESCFTFFARLQNILKSALKLQEFNEEHRRLIIRKFLKSVHPTLRGHLELRETEPTFEEYPAIANRIELALALPKGSVVELNHVQNDVSRPSQRSEKKERPISKCTLCNKNGHELSNCFGNPLSKRFDLARFSQTHGLPMPKN